MRSAFARVIHQRSSLALATLALLLALGVGFALADDYGSSWDDRDNWRVGKDALGAYLSPQGYLSYLENGRETLVHHGPSYFMAYRAFGSTLAGWFPGWGGPAARHFTNYITFLLAIGCMYMLARKVLPARMAWLAPTLFATQPLLFGHAFINQKDMPFLAFFLASVTTGIELVDWRWRDRSDRQSTETPALGGSWQTGRRDWGAASAPAKLALLGTVALGVVAFLDLFWAGKTLSLLLSILGRAYNGEAWSPVNEVFKLVAQEPYRSLAAYEFKLTWGYWLGRILFLLGLASAGFVLARQTFPNSLTFGRTSTVQLASILILEGALLGFTISIRSIGVFAGALVVSYWVLRMRGRELLLLVPYWLSAAVATYVTWPYVWRDPWNSIRETISYTVDFRSLPVLFRGAQIGSEDLPWDYFPTLAGVQLTEPVVILFLLGLAAIAWRLWRRHPSSSYYVVLLIWLGVPLMALIAFHMAIYNGLRQMLFVLPAVLLISGMGLARVLEMTRSGALRTALIALAILPGLLGIWIMHPYEYAYFNAFAGGARGAQGNFEMDYWCTSLKESMEYVNEHAGENALVVSWGAAWIAGESARPGIAVRPKSNRRVPDYYLACSWGLMSSPPNAELTKLFEVKRGSAILGSVYGLGPDPSAECIDVRGVSIKCVPQ